MVNQTPDEGCLSRVTIGREGSLFISDKEICPEEYRDDRRFRPCRKGALLEAKPLLAVLFHAEIALPGSFNLQL
jgi:hypothetical protein